MNGCSQHHQPALHCWWCGIIVERRCEERKLEADRDRIMGDHCD